MLTTWLERSAAALADALCRRLLGRRASVFQVLGEDTCRRLARASLAALQTDLAANRHDAMYASMLDFVQEAMPNGLGFGDLRYYGQSLRALVLGAVDEAPELVPAARRAAEDWLYELAQVGAMRFLVERDRLYHESAVAREVSQLETQMEELKGLNEGLEVRLGERTAELVAKNASLAEALSDLQRTQEQWLQAEKMASLGRLVAGIAHEIKNPLNFVNNFAELSLEFADEIEPLVRALAGTATGDELADILPQLVDNLRRIHEHGRRADAIINAMLMHAREGSDQAMSTDLNQLVRTHAALAYQGFRTGDRGFQVEFVEQMDDGLAAVPIAYQEMSRVVHNLIDNACYALRERRRHSGPGYRPTLEVETRRVGDTAVIRVRDNGSGIPADVRRRIFDPFFTTKPPGEGTGLGLSICYDIVVKQLGGHFEVDSTEGERSEFTVTVPFGPNAPQVQALERGGGKGEK